MMNLKKVLKPLLSKFDRGIRTFFIILIRSYQIVASPIFGGSCRFEPSCSQYGLEAFRKFPLRKAIYLTTKRVLKCHPMGPFGHDPLPEKHQ